jgi:hypothetical protein
MKLVLHMGDHALDQIALLRPRVVENAIDVIERLAFTSRTRNEFIDRVVRSLDSWVIPN